MTAPAKGEPQPSFSDALLGVAIILLAALLPGVIYKFSGGLMGAAAGGAPRASGGVTAQAGQSVTSTADMTRMIMDRNAPRPALAGSSTASSGARQAGASGAAGARGAAGAAGVRGATSALAGPAGVAAMAATMAGGALESGGRWLAGHAATGGGVFGDVEAPHVPSPPISRVPYGSRAPHDSGDHKPKQTTEPATKQTQSTHITIIQQPADQSAGQRPAVDPSDPHVIIPGTVVPEVPEAKGPAALPRKPSARTGRDGDDHE